MARTATMEKKYIKNFKPNTSRPLITIKCNIPLNFIHYLFNNEYVLKVKRLGVFYKKYVCNYFFSRVTLLFGKCNDIFAPDEKITSNDKVVLSIGKNS